MCTLSWRNEGHRLEVLFNRDEQKSRLKAHVPQYWRDYHAVFPVDPQGGGTWLAVTENGDVYALLNNYQRSNDMLASTANQVTKHVTAHSEGEQIIPEKQWQSRGKVITLLLQRSDGSFQENCTSLPLSSFLPFTLVHLHPTKATLCCHWDGETVRFEQPQSPLISSGVALEQVRDARHRCYAQHNQSLQDLRLFHQSHQPGPSALSVCMHREDAQTVSFSHIRISEQIEFHYQAGSPCMPLGPSVLVSVPRNADKASPKNNFSCL